MKKNNYYHFIFLIVCGFMINTKLNAKTGRNIEETKNSFSKEHMDFTPPYQKLENSSFDFLQPFDSWPRDKKVLALNLAAVGVIGAIGGISWEYGSSSFHFQNEGWFSHDSKYGGADKLGHCFSAYALTSVYNSIYKYWGYSDREAIIGGALSSWAQMTLIEFGDGVSAEHGFSWEDEVMDTIGVGMAYLRHRFPSLKDKIDFRLEWFPSSAFRHGSQSDPFTDYSGQKYLLALKPDGFLKTNNPYLKAVELHFGYYTRGYDGEKDSHSRHRSTYVGIGFNVTYLLEELTGHNAWRIFDYIQVPYTYMSSSSEYH